MFKIRLKALLAVSLCFVACIQFATAIDHVKCTNITTDMQINGHLSFTHQTDCFIVQKHDETSDRLRVITRGQVTQEEYYICTYVTQDNHGLGGGCAAQYRKQNYNICPKTYSPAGSSVVITISCATKPHGCEYMLDGSYTMTASWVQTEAQCASHAESSADGIKYGFGLLLAMLLLSF